MFFYIYQGIIIVYKFCVWCVYSQISFSDEEADVKVTTSSSSSEGSSSESEDEEKDKEKSETEEGEISTQSEAEADRKKDVEENMEVDKYALMNLWVKVSVL